MSDRHFISLVSAFVLLCAPVSVSGAPPAPQRPNFLFILVDDLGWADLGCYGNQFNETPNIDQLAGDGMRFTDAYAACCVCSPTRASIMTGKYPATLHLTDFIPGHRRPWARLKVPAFNQQLPLREMTIAEALKPAGYVSASFGKWHLTASTVEPASHYPDKQGFDEYVVTRGGHLAPRFGCQPPLELEEGADLADVLTDRAERFMEANRDRPFFLYLSHFAVHIPLQAKKEVVAKYEAKPKPEQGVNHPVYAAMLESVDKSVGRLMNKLDELGLAERTVVIFVSDNGGLRQTFRGTGPIVTSNAPLRNEKGTLYEGGIRVPMIVRWPGLVEKGSTCGVPVSTVDFFPTMLVAGGVMVESAGQVDGRSILPLLKGAKELPRDAIYWHYPHYHHSTPAGAVRAGDYKLIESYENGRLELYNLAQDIGEQHNLADEMPSKAAELRHKLVRWRKSINAQMPTPNPDFDGARAHAWGRRGGKKPIELPEGHTFPIPVASGVKAPDGSLALARPCDFDIPRQRFGPRGTVAMWFRAANPVLAKGNKLSLIDSEALRTFIDPRGTNVWVLMHAGPAMTGKQEGERKRFYWLGAALTHLKGDRWYHAAWTWDVKDASRNGFFLDGIRQTDGPPYKDPPLFKPADRDVTARVGAAGLTISGLSFFDQALDAAALTKLCREAGHEAYTTEGLVFASDTFVPTDVDWEHPVYATAFEDPAALKDWRLEGGWRKRVADGKLVLETQPPGEKAAHLVCWLDREVPADFLLEFTVRPQDRQQGLNIVFFNARGVNGKGIFDPSVQPRDGLFRLYHSGDLNNYHISYWAGGRGTANVRKNKGFRLAAVGLDMVANAPADAFQTVRLYKRGGKIRLMIDDVVAVTCDDDGTTYGPVHTHSGWIGLRQMGHTHRCEYEYVRVYPLKTP